MNTRELTCAMCKYQFTSDLSETEAREQFHREYPGIDFIREEMEVVCDDCFKMLDAALPTVEWARSVCNYRNGE